MAETCRSNSSEQHSRSLSTSSHPGTSQPTLDDRHMYPRQIGSSDEAQTPTSRRQTKPNKPPAWQPLHGPTVLPVDCPPHWIRCLHLGNRAG